MQISTFNINKFCGAYSNRGRYYNPRNLDFRTPIKEIVDSVLCRKSDIIFLEEFTDNSYIEAEKLFDSERYSIFHNKKLTEKSGVVAITFQNSLWSIDTKYSSNKLLGMKFKKNDIELKAIGFHNTSDSIKNVIDQTIRDGETDIVLGDFNDTSWLDSLSTQENGYVSLISNDKITFKPAQTTIDGVLLKNELSNKVGSKTVMQTYASDHNLVTFTLGF